MFRAYCIEESFGLRVNLFNLSSRFISVINPKPFSLFIPGEVSLYTLINVHVVNAQRPNSLTSAMVGFTSAEVKREQHSFATRRLELSSNLSLFASEIITISHTFLCFFEELCLFFFPLSLLIISIIDQKCTRCIGKYLSGALLVICDTRRWCGRGI